MSQSPVSGGDLTKVPPVFSPDAQALICACGRVVRVYSTSTRTLLRQLVGHTDQITTLVLRHSTSSQVYTSALDGTVRLWDFSEGRLIKTFTVGHPVVSLVPPSPQNIGAKNAKHVYISIRFKKEATGEQQGRVCLYDLGSQSIVKFVAKTSAGVHLYSSAPGNYVAALDRRRALVWNTSDGSLLTLRHTKKLTALSFDPAETQVAAGDVTGRILLWTNFFNMEDFNEDEQQAAAACSTYHWHSDIVRSLQFSADGSYLLSGGVEGVLVQWQLETMLQDFLPRLGGEICSIVNNPRDPSIHVVACDTNSLKVVNLATMSIESTMQGVSPNPIRNLQFITSQPSDLHMQRARGPDLVRLDPKTGFLALSAPNCGVQFFDVGSNQHISTLEVEPRNFATVKKGKQQYQQPQLATYLSHFAFSHDGEVLATIDARPLVDAGELGMAGTLFENPEEECLKFWHRSVTGHHPFKINTRADAPHRKPITSLVFHPHADLAVTTSSDSQFKVWGPVALPKRPNSGKDEDDRPSVCWSCRSVGSYRNESLSNATFAHDGSVLGIAAQDSITLWQVESNMLLGVLATQPQCKTIAGLCFVAQSPNLVAICRGSADTVVMWDLVTMQVVWTMQMQAQMLFTHPRHNHFGIVVPIERDYDNSDAQGGDLIVRPAHVLLFEGYGVEPIMGWRLNKTSVGYVQFMPSVQSGDRVVIVTQDRDIVTCDRVIDDVSMPEQLGRESGSESGVEKNGVETAVAANASSSRPGSVLEAVFGKPPTKLTGSGNARKNDEVVLLNKLKDGVEGTFADIPSHALPPMTKVCSSFLKSLLVSSGKNQA